jgi:hypothetical protein
MEGLPAAKPAAVVPVPPWWTTAAIRGKSQSKGADSMATTSSGKSPGFSPPQPASSKPRWRERISAAITNLATCSGFRPVMLPKPTNTGGGYHTGEGGRNQ